MTKELLIFYMKTTIDYYGFSDFLDNPLQDFAKVRIESQYSTVDVSDELKILSISVGALQSTIIYGMHRNSPEVDLLLHPGTIVIMVTDWSADRHLFINIPGLEEVSSMHFMLFLLEELKSQINAFMVQNTKSSSNSYSFRTFAFSSEPTCLSIVSFVLRDESINGGKSIPCEQISIPGFYLSDRTGSSLSLVNPYEVNYSANTTSALMSALTMRRYEQNLKIPLFDADVDQIIVYSEEELDETVNMMRERGVQLFSPALDLSESRII